MSKTAIGEYKKKERPRLLVCDPNFHRMIKTEASREGLTVMKWTQKFSGITSLREEFERKKDEESQKKKGGGFNFNPF